MRILHAIGGNPGPNPTTANPGYSFPGLALSRWTAEIKDAKGFLMAFPIKPHLLLTSLFLGVTEEQVSRQFHTTRETGFDLPAVYWRTASGTYVFHESLPAFLKLASILLVLCWRFHRGSLDTVCISRVSLSLPVAQAGPLTPAPSVKSYGHILPVQKYKRVSSRLMPRIPLTPVKDVLRPPLD